MRNSYTPTDAADYNSALRNTDAAAMVVGEGMVKGGSGAIASGLGGIVLMANEAVNASKGYNYGGKRTPKVVLVERH